MSPTPETINGTRSVAVLGAQAISTGTTTVKIPSATAMGLYYVLACADDTNSVIENDETNNCIASASLVNVVR